MSGERGSLQPETLLIIVCVVGVLAAALVFAVRSGGKRARALEEFAKMRGWTYSRTDTQGRFSTVEKFFTDQRFLLENIMTVESGKRNVVLFDCGYHNRERRRGGNFGTGCLIESGRFPSAGRRVEIIERTWADEVLLEDQVDMGDAEFRRNFIVLSKDPASAHTLVSRAVQEALVEHKNASLFNPVRIGLGAGAAVVLTGYHAEPERWLDLLELARRIESTFK